MRAMSRGRIGRPTATVLHLGLKLSRGIGGPTLAFFARPAGHPSPMRRCRGFRCADGLVRWAHT